MILNFDLNDLLAFRALVEHGSFREAAETVFISQSALSRRIDKLESALGVKLFERTTRRVRLTAAGHTFAPRVDHLLNDLDDALSGISSPASRHARVTVACVPSAAYYFMPAVIARYKALYPDVHIRLIDTSAGAVCAAVMDGQADFGLSFSGWLDADIEFEWLIEESYVAACRRDHPLAQRKSVSWSDFYTWNYISLDKVSGNRLLLDQALAHTTPARPSVCETRHVTTMLGMVEAGLGIAAVPTMALPGDVHPVLTSVPLVEPGVVRQVGIIKRRGRVLSPTAAALERMVTEMKSVQEAAMESRPVART
ncbi:LysR family transcriptional regulator [Enterobacteriaceae bacterium 4M9]|nr:LysR family transcriptional regulator [Enterobacteriaceae bacterium 4M9]